MQAFRLCFDGAALYGSGMTPILRLGDEWMTAVGDGGRYGGVSKFAFYPSLG
ncbi:protein of unknown function [Methylocaldum szegediense]|uniref:Uncharacterized protein n=1 Tax=Methylocaldum szegediense TaxID=73780 RepID=A0ABN8X043_9GAMM|nr:protein of unknown function [Methylocaldum szegediense]